MKQTRPLTITGGKIVTPAGVTQGAVRLVDGLIEAIGADVAAQDGDQVLAAKGKLVAPGLIDFGVFKIDKPAFHFGGITRAALMPDQSPPLDYPSRVNYIAKSGKPDLWVHPLAAATRGLAGEELAEIAMMRDAGARGVATGRKWIADSGVMLRVLRYAAMLDLVVVSHAEDSGLVGEAVATAGEMATRLGLSSAPPQAEALAVAREVMAEVEMQRMPHLNGWLGLIAWSAGERDEAIAALARAVELDPANMGYRRLLRDYRASAGGVRARASALLDRTWAWLGGQRG